MFSFSRAILLMSMRTRDMMNDANLLEKRNLVFDIHRPNQFA